VRDVLTIAGYGIRESIRRRVFLVVLVLTLGFLALYIAGARIAFNSATSFAEDQFVDAKAFTGSTVFGMAMFATLFLGAVLAAFLTINVVRGDAERGLLQPLVVRPIGRAQVLFARFGAAAIVSAVYVAVVYGLAMVGTAIVGDWWPDNPIVAGLELAAAAVVISALSTAGSVFLTSTANGIAVFMLYGAGLTAGLLGQIGHALSNQSLQHISKLASWALPFEALFQDSLNATVSGAGGITGALLKLGPFGGAQPAGGFLGPFVGLYLAGVLGAAIWAFRRRDL
jgi:ABC-type transport system involved in multi-copper enzyme maturation permease subunit